jgi:hypothetical protein
MSLAESRRFAPPAPAVLTAVNKAHLQAATSLPARAQAFPASLLKTLARVASMAESRTTRMSSRLAAARTASNPQAVLPPRVPRRLAPARTVPSPQVTSPPQVASPPQAVSPPRVPRRLAPARTVPNPQAASLLQTPPSRRRVRRLPKSPVSWTTDGVNGGKSSIEIVIGWLTANDNYTRCSRCGPAVPLRCQS